MRGVRLIVFVAVSGYWIQDSLSVEPGFRMPIVCRGFRIPLAVLLDGNDPVNQVEKKTKRLHHSKS